ncbi:hypothetical protein F2Q69_00013721 [Brassica cretica]|uniref:Uncharacterized protein n=1 Tax=Brassica cretica TaxID=69181 RepID=A0A8S9QPT5_BRACR|nr:hypothetical protein F2Q69_00013721 [Brassica cretica]
MEEMKIDKKLPISIDRNLPKSIDYDLSLSNPMKSQPDSHTRAEIDQMVEEIYKTLGTTKERLDKRCDDICFPWDITIGSLTSQTQEMHREIVEIQRYIARRPEASTIDRHINISTDSHRRTPIDEATPTNRGGLVPKVISDMSDINNHVEEISADTYATLVRHQFKLEFLGDRLQKIENATETMNDKWRRGDKAMIDFTECLKEPKLTSNLTELNFACLGAWYTWDQILQTSLEGKARLVPAVKA